MTINVYAHHLRVSNPGILKTQIPADFVRSESYFSSSRCHTMVLLEPVLY